MQPSRTTAALLLAAVGLALLTNSLWLFPDEGDALYTYDRSEITVENGTIQYANRREGPGHEFNDLARVACDRFDSGRACAFDRYLVDDGPVTLPDDSAYSAETAFVRLGERYYHRTEEETTNGTVYDVERIAPRALLGEIASNASVPPSTDLRRLPVQFRVAVTGEPASTTDLPDRNDAGRVYRVNDTYYAVVVVDEGAVDRPLFADWMRLPLVVCGFFALVAALLVGAGDRESEFRTGRR